MRCSTNIRLGTMRAASAALWIALTAFCSAADWPGWRGPSGDGISTEPAAPVTWDGPSGKHVVWSVPVAGVGHSSPIVAAGKVFLTTCLEQDGQRMLICLDRKTGETLWQREVLRAPLERKHQLNSYASGTPATDGTLVFVTFLEPEFSSNTERTPGQMLVAAYDFDGQQRWVARPGGFASVHGYCSSPVLFQNLVIVNGDHDGDSYLVALDRATGKTIWKVDRPNQTRSYVTPIIREIDGRTQMVLSGSKHVASYDPRDGSVHWTIQGPTEQFVASLVYDGKLLFLTAGYPDLHILAIRPDGHGDVTDSHVVWRTNRGCAYVPSPIVVGEYFFVAADGGTVTNFDAATGKIHWRERLGSHYSASPVAVNGLLYFLDDEGTTKVVRPGKTFELIAENKLDDHCYASPAVSDGQLFLRGSQRLYCIGQE